MRTRVRLSVAPVTFLCVCWCLGTIDRVDSAWGPCSVMRAVVCNTSPPDVTRDKQLPPAPDACATRFTQHIDKRYVVSVCTGDRGRCLFTEERPRTDNTARPVCCGSAGSCHDSYLIPAITHRGFKHWQCRCNQSQLVGGMATSSTVLHLHVHRER